MNHYRNPALYRVSSGLPSVFFRALGKELLCQVPKEKHSKKTLGKEGSLPTAKKHSAKTFFAKCFLALDKEPSLPSVFFTLGKDLLCRVQKKKHSAK